MYRRLYEIGNVTVASNGVLTWAINMQNWQIINYHFILWRPGVKVYNTIGQDFNIYLTDNGRVLNFKNTLGAAISGDRLFGYIDYMD